jgi:AraC-like DNA-binding protein
LRIYCPRPPADFIYIRLTMTLTLNYYTLCIGITVVNLVMIAFFLLVVREGRNQVANRLLSLFCLAHAAANSDPLASNHLYDHFPQLIEVDTLLLLTVGPLCLLYVQAMTQIRFRIRLKHLLHLLPVAGYLIWLLPFKLQASSVQLAQYHDYISGRQPIPWMAVYFPKVVLLTYLIAAYRRVIRHQRTIRELLADIEKKDLRWLTSLLVVLVGLYAAWVLNNEGLFSCLYVGLAHVAYSYWLGFYVINQKAIYTHVAPTVSLDALDEQPKIRYRNSTMTEADKRTLVERVALFMLDEKPYLNKDLTLTVLADQMRLSPTQLSQVLNEGFGENFYSFINRHRVEESKRLLIDPAFSHYSILGVAFEAGFNAKSTFNKSFREVVGQAPSDYQKGHVPPLPSTETRAAKHSRTSD